VNAIAYVRVSTKRQEEGTSPEAQERVIREYCAREGLDVVAVVRDADWSGGWTIRPGLDELRERVRAGEASVIVVSVRDRFARGVYAQVLKEEFEELGARLIALDSLGDDETPESELFDGIRDVFSGYEKRRIVQRMHQGKLERARRGQILPTKTPKFGFKYDENRTNYVPNEPEMALIRRIFRLVGAEKKPLWAVKKAFEREGVASPAGNRHWDPSFIKKVVTDDVYFPHTYAEISELVRPEVAAGLDESQEYGVFWFNTRQTVVSAERVPLPGGGTEVRKVRRRRPRPKEEWIAVPVSHEGVGIKRDWVIMAREEVKGNQVTPPKGPRVFELSGLFRCQECNRAMQTYARWDKKMGKHYFYYRCQSRARYGPDACTLKRALRAPDVDELVWEAVTALLTRPDLLRTGYERYLEQERARDVDATRWESVLRECETQSERLLDLYLGGGIHKARYEDRARRIEERKQAALVEVRRAAGREERLRQIEEGREKLLAEYANLTPEILSRLTPERRIRIHRALGVRVEADVSHDLRVAFTNLQGITEVVHVSVVMVLGVQLQVEVA
jgi:DNA invertase Pin-like site-specific DNA recombinase